MVQRKEPNKLGIQADRVKANKLLVNLKPSFLQHQESKNRGPELKKMKKSRPAKHSQHECNGSSSFIRQVPQPGKPPPAPVFPSTAPSPQKETQIKTSDAKPNYMKSTTSSDARKELHQVTSRNLQALFDSKLSSRKAYRNSKACSASDHKPARTLARTSSLKLVRGLTKAASFKPGRASAKKYSPLVLIEDLNVQRATCSSTLKDSKFPDNLTLNSGGTEAEGTSIMKVCRYAYCSLNSHYHPPLPPLKCFLSAKRRMLKTQRTIKLGCLSPRRPKPNKDIIGENETAVGEGLSNSEISSVIQEKHEDFFLQICTKEMEAAADVNATFKCEGNYQLASDASFNYITSSVNVGDKTVTEPEDRQALESLSDESPFTGIVAHGNSNGNSDTISICTVAAECSAEEKHTRAEVGAIYRDPLAAEKSLLECLRRQLEVKESTESVDAPYFEPSNMDWKVGEYSTLYLDGEVDRSSQTSHVSDSVGNPTELDSFLIPDGSIFKSDYIASKCSEEIQAGEFLGKCFDEESISSNAGSNQEFEVNEYIQDQIPDPSELSTTMDEIDDGDKMFNSVQDTVTILENPLEHPIEEPCAAAEDGYIASQENNETGKMDLQIKDEIVNSLQTDDAALTDNSESEFDHDDYAAGQMWELDSKDSGTEKDCLKVHDPVKTEAALGVNEKEQADPVKELISIEIVNSSQGCLQLVKDKSEEGHDDNHLDVIAEVEKSNQTSPEDIPDGIEDQSPDKFTSRSIENLNGSVLNEAAMKSFVCTDSGDQPDSRMKIFSLADNAHQNSCITEMEISRDFGQATSPASTNASRIGTGDDHMRRSSDKEVPESCKTRSLTKGCKRSIEEEKEKPKEFNPRAPNFLPVEPDQEAEEVNLKHQMTDERKNSEEWMLDYALQQALTKLAPARRRKVELLVEAFETVLPTTKCDNQLWHTSVAFAQATKIQACN